VRDQGDRPELVVPVSERDHVVGGEGALVTLVEYGDFECPFCGQAHVVLEEVRRALGPRLRFVFRHFPLSSVHPHALRAAEAAEAAGAQDAFFPMHDLLYENQDALEDADLVGYAAELSLDVDRFAGELASHVHRPRVRADFMGGVKSGVNGTPTFFIDGRRHDGAWDRASLLEALDAAMRRKGRRAA
jgi:protein-disulfide isomerase